MVVRIAIQSRAIKRFPIRKQAEYERLATEIEDLRREAQEADENV